MHLVYQFVTTLFNGAACSRSRWWFPSRKGETSCYDLSCVFVSACVRLCAHLSAIRGECCASISFSGVSSAPYPYVALHSPTWTQLNTTTLPCRSAPLCTRLLETAVTSRIQIRFAQKLTWTPKTPKGFVVTNLMSLWTVKLWYILLFLFHFCFYSQVYPLNNCKLLNSIYIYAVVVRDIRKNY